MLHENIRRGANDPVRQKMFKLSDIDQNSEMKAEQDELDEILKSSVPGLVSKSRQKASTTDPSQSRQNNSGTGHKILLEPSVFNMRLLLPPSLSFIQRLKDIVPVDSDISMNTLTSFLDDFMVNVFLPQLDETVTDLCTLSFIAADAFTEDPQWTKVSPRPIFKVNPLVEICGHSLTTISRALSNSWRSCGNLAKCFQVFPTTRRLRSS